MGKIYTVARDHPLADLLEEDHLVPLSSPLLRVESELLKLVPIVETIKSPVLDSIY